MSKWLMSALLCAPFSVTASSVDWFQNNTSLVQAHQHLLERDLSSLFTSLVETWQQKHNAIVESNLNDLLIQSLDMDCGKGLESAQTPAWIKSVIVRRSDIQSPRRDNFRASIEIHTTKEIANVTLTKWVDSVISANDEALLDSSSLSTNDNEKVYIKRYNLNNPLPIGLYRLNVVTKDNTSWNSWVVLSDAKAKYSVRWTAKDKWKIEKNALLNKHCPLPKLNVSLYDYEGGSYHMVWSKMYESGYPESLAAVNLPPDRYILAVSMTHQRWQGPILVERTQIISKNYEISGDDE